MKKIITFLLGIIIVISCNRQEGCPDEKALNYEMFPEKDNFDMCCYSRVSFYISNDWYWDNGNQVCWDAVELYINQNKIGNITSIWPYGPGNCSASGTVQYQFNDGESIDWEAKIYLQNGVVLLSTGMVSPSRNTECIVVNVY